MKKNQKNIILISITAIALAIAIIIGIIITDKGANSNNAIKINYYNQNTSYKDYFDKGIIKLDIKEIVKLPENYLEYKVTGETEIESKNNLTETLNTIVNNSQIYIPDELLNGYLGDIYSDIKYVAEQQNLSIEDYLKTIYTDISYEEFIDRNIEAYREEIKEELVYQALAKELEISVEQSDIEQYYSIRISEDGYNYEDLKNVYGEELLYKSTLQNKIEQELLKKFSEQ